MGSLKEEDAPVEPTPSKRKRFLRTSVYYEDFRVVQNEQLEKEENSEVSQENQWVDDGEDRDPNFDPAKFERMGKAARNRGKAKKRTIECHVCGRSFQVNPALVHGGGILDATDAQEGNMDQLADIGAERAVLAGLFAL